MNYVIWTMLYELRYMNYVNYVVTKIYVIWTMLYELCYMNYVNYVATKSMLYELC